MSETFYTILTAIGRSKLANAQVNGTAVNFTTMKAGDGNGAYYSPNESQTDLVNTVWSGAINSLYIDPNNSTYVIVEAVIPEDVGNFYIREVGIFDDAGVLIGIGKYPETYKPTLAQGSGKDLYLRYIMETSNASVVTLKVDPSVVLATKNDIVLHNDDPAAHLAFRQRGMVKDSVRVATTAEISLSGQQTIDGVAVSAGESVLVKNQTTGSVNGIYVVSTGAWTRRTDADTASKLPLRMMVPVREGTVNGGTMWTLTNTAPITIETTALVFEPVLHVYKDTVTATKYNLLVENGVLTLQEV